MGFRTQPSFPNYSDARIQLLFLKVELSWSDLGTPYLVAQKDPKRKNSKSSCFTDLKTGFRFEVSHPKNVRHPCKVLFSQVTTVRVARIDEFQVHYFRSQIACYMHQLLSIGIKCVNFL